MPAAQPDDTSVRLGFHGAAVVDHGLLAPFDGDTGFEYEGALIDAGDSGQGLPKAARAWLDTELRDRLDEAAAWQVVDGDDGGRTTPRSTTR